MQPGQAQRHAQLLLEQLEQMLLLLLGQRVVLLVARLGELLVRVRVAWPVRLGPGFLSTPSTRMRVPNSLLCPAMRVPPAQHRCEACPAALR